jgi:RNA polymerase sigma factor (sigma-70 family)
VNSLTDQQLLREYAASRSEAAFAELVRRHVNFVYSAALRMVCDAHLAEDVTQGVFLVLAQTARQLTDRPVLSGWLHRTAQNLGSKAVRTDVRRRAREQEAASMNELLATEPNTVWEYIAPHLDDALGELSEPDRDALLLRYFERKSAREMARTLGTSEDTAQKRVSRAVERLREFLAKRGVNVGASGLVVVISAHAVQAAPVGLAVTISTAAAVAGTAALHASTAIAATETIAMTTIQKITVAAAVAVLAGAGIYEARQNLKLRGEIESQLHQIEHLKLESESLSNRLPVVADGKALPNDQFNELLRLRGDVGVLRRQKTELENSLANLRTSKPTAPNRGTEQQPPTVLPEDYPKTADGATKGIFEAWGRGDWDTFLANFDLDGGREVWDKAFTDEMKSNLLGLVVVSVGQPTNSFGPNMWFVPYTVRFKDGNEKTFRLHIAQDSRTQRWILKGGF